MAYYVYILINKAKTRIYTGMTNDVRKRLVEHNIGKVVSSKQYRPYKILHVEECTSRDDAARLEKFYKTTSGRRKIKELIVRRRG